MQEYRDTKKFGILAWPAYSTKPGNPYNYIIYNEIEKKGYPVYEFDFNLRNLVKSGLFLNYKILHFHWPANLLTFSTRTQAKRRLLLFYFFIKIIKILNKKIVWTVHNLKSHEGEHLDLQQELHNFLYKNTDGFISLNKYGLEIIKEKSTNTIKQKFIYIPHPHYKNYYPNKVDRYYLRQKLSISNDKFVFLFIGQIRAYKNLTGLINAFLNLNDKNTILLIAGEVFPDISTEIYNLTKLSDQIILHNSFVKDEELQLFLNASDLVVNPYNSVFNSGSVFLNLSFNKVTLAPQKNTFIELQAEFGPHFIKLYTEDINAEQMDKAMKEVTAEKETLGMVNAEQSDPEKIAGLTIDFYNNLIS